MRRTIHNLMSTDAGSWTAPSCASFVLSSIHRRLNAGDAKERLSDHALVSWGICKSSGRGREVHAWQTLRGVVANPHE
jgi:hypothetical protein